MTISGVTIAGAVKILSAAGTSRARSGGRRHNRPAVWQPLLLAVLFLPAAPHRVGAASVQPPQEPSRLDALIDSAMAALERDQLEHARDLADRALDWAPRDPEALIARGRVYLAWPRIGRFQALRLFREAARLSPEDPEPHYWIGRTGIALMHDDGEAIARRGLERALALDPLYGDAWELWRRLYLSPEDRAEMVERFRPHDDELRVRARIGQLWVENGECDVADSLLTTLERQLEDPRWPAWRAECAFLSGHDGQGAAHYERAMARAADDTIGALWAQVASIARPDERATYQLLSPEARPEFYRAFWRVRDPNVRTAVNERMGEHFRRRAEARDRFRLLHPLSLYHYSHEYRFMVSRVSSAERERYAAAQLERGAQIAEALSQSGPLAASERLLAALRGDTLDPELERLLELDVGFREPDLTGISPDILPLGRNLPDMIDDRGLAFIRHGPPERFDFKTLDVEQWAYESTPPLRLRFDKSWNYPDPPLPDMLFRPLTAEQARSVAVAMTSDRSSLSAPLQFGFWFARFRNPDHPLRTDLLVFPEAGVEATGVLWDGAGRELGRADASDGWLELTSPPGSLVLALDAERSDSLGRFRGVVSLPDFSGDSLTLSDVLVSSAVDARDVDRETAADLSLPSLAVSANEPFLVYLEVYGLEARDGLRQFEVTYEFEQRRGWLSRLLGGERRIALRFERTVAAGSDGVTVEAVRVDAGEFAPGRYRLRVTVRDLVAGGEGNSRDVTLELLK